MTKRLLTHPLLMSLLLVFLFWQGSVSLFAISPRYLPSLAMVAQDVQANWPQLLASTGRTALETLLGFGLGTLFGLACGILFFYVSWIDRAWFPLFVVSQTVPVIAFGALVVIWFGNTLFAKVMIAFYLTFLPVTLNTKRGLQMVDPLHISLLRSFGASGFKRFLALHFPAAAPSIFVAMKLGISLGLVGAIVGEWFGDTVGLGVLLIQAMYNEDVVRMWTLIVICGALGALLYGVVERCERSFAWWGKQP
ncbi:ABC transporter permease [Enterobacterales bacterium CwR94]|nr:ABC transporter permease [Enterobacterales bacterium CwR94]